MSPLGRHSDFWRPDLNQVFFTLQCNSFFKMSRLHHVAQPFDALGMTLAFK
jgi:hypothetical protein